MSGDSEATDWRRLREFADVDLTRSFVLSWYLEAETLFIDMDIQLLPDHPFYEKPRPAEKVCIRPALLEFPFCAGISRDDADGRESVGISPATLGHGAVSGLWRRGDGRYEFRGSFGRVTIKAERPVLRLKRP